MHACAASSSAVAPPPALELRAVTAIYCWTPEDSYTSVLLYETHNLYEYRLRENHKMIVPERKLENRYRFSQF